MAAIQIRVGASLDRSTSTVFAQIQEQAKRANRAIADEARKAAKAEETAWKGAQRELARMEREKEREATKGAHARAAAAKAAAKAEETAAKDKVRAMMRLDAEMTRYAEGQSRERARAEERAANDAARAWVRTREKQQKAAAAAAKASSGRGEAIAGMANRALLGAGRFGLSALSDMAAGAGVRFDMGSQFAAGADMESRATQLANAGYMPGTKGANGRRQDPSALINESFAIGNATGTAANDVMGGMQQFVGKTGDLESARAVMGDLAKLSKATGSSLEDMADAAADVSNQLGDVPDKGARIKDVMMTIAGQGKLGAVEIKDLASQMAKVVASAQMFEGDTGEGMKTLGAIAQETRAHGGAASASQAATAVNSLASVFKTKARVAAFGKAGISLEGAGGKIRNIEDIIVESLQKTQRKTRDTSNVALHELFGGQLPGKAIGGFEQIYRSTYATTSGTEQEKAAAATRAVREEFERLRKVAMSEQELRESFNNSLKTGKSQAEIFNNQLQTIAMDAQKKLGPALMKLAPVVIDVTKALADFAVHVLGISPKPQEGIAEEVAGAKTDVANAKTIINDPKTTPEQKKAAFEALRARKESLKKTREGAATGIKSAETSGGGVASEAIHEFYSGYAKEIKGGEWGKLLLKANVLGGAYRAGSAIVNAASGTTERQKETGANVAAAVEGTGDISDEEKNIDAQLKSLSAIEKTLADAPMMKPGVVKVEVTNMGRGSSGGGGTNRGMDPTE